MKVQGLNTIRVRFFARLLRSFQQIFFLSLCRAIVRAQSYSDRSHSGISGFFLLCFHTLRFSVGIFSFPFALRLREQIFFFVRPANSHLYGEGSV